MIARLLAAAERFGDRPAIEPADRPAISYRALFAGAADHAATLAAAGVGPGAVVTIDATRSVDFVRAALGTWLAGAAFLPIDPATPPARRAQMLARVGRGAGHRTGLAYVMFTSGSGGEPRGVMVRHRGLPALIDAQIAAFGLEPGSRALWLHAPIFDATISDLGTALVAGATLVIGDDAAVRSPAGLRVTLEGRAISHVDLPTGLLRFLEVDRLPPALRTVILGGEACPVALVRRLAERVRVVVVYGPTEATVCSSLVVVDPATWTRPLIGAPLPGVRYQVVDGELWIGGDGLALGYAGDDAATAARFVDDDHGDRWYRTGDRVEPLDDGALAFGGRTDRQVKLAGRRIELDEVEAALRACPGVGDAAVCARPLDPAQPAAPRRLVGFVEGGGDDPRAALRDRLPAWMIPAIVEPVDRLPRTVTGKVDHRALAIRPLRAAAADKHAGGDPLAAELAPLWCAALGVPSVGPDDRFAELGGDSLATLALVAAAEARALPLTPAHLDGDPGFAEVVARLAAASAAPPPITVAELAARMPALAPARPPAAASRDRSGAVLFTGATGFLGARLLAAWRARDTRPVVCLVRARDQAAARRRLGVDDVAVVLGDLAQPRLGLDELTWRRLGNEVATVVHAGGLVHLGLDWDALAPTNLGATVELARLVSTGRPKAWHHMSSLGVFAATDRPAGRHAERSHPGDGAVVFGAYAQSKLAAEQVAHRMVGSAAPLTIHRLGLLTGDAITGAAPPGEQLGMTLRGLARLGAVPAGAGALRLDVTPVDHAAAAVAALALRAEELAIDELHHVASTTGATLDQLAAALRAEGVALDELAPAAWAARARDGFADPDVAIAYLSLMRAHAPDRARLRPYDLFLATGADFAVERTDAILTTLGVTPPAIDAALLRRLVAAALGARA